MYFTDSAEAYKYLKSNLFFKQGQEAARFNTGIEFDIHDQGIGDECDTAYETFERKEAFKKDKGWKLNPYNEEEKKEAWGWGYDYQYWQIMADIEAQYQ